MNKIDDTISRQAAIDAVKEAYENDEMFDGYEYRLQELPSTQPEIVRCKDCKHFAGEGMYCSCDIIVQFDHFYCYHAERRQDV